MLRSGGVDDRSRPAWAGGEAEREPLEGHEKERTLILSSFSVAKRLNRKNATGLLQNPPEGRSGTDRADRRCAVEYEAEAIEMLAAIRVAADRPSPVPLKAGIPC